MKSCMEGPHCPAWRALGCSLLLGGYWTPGRGTRRLEHVRAPAECEGHCGCCLGHLTKPGSYWTLSQWESNVISGSSPNLGSLLHEVWNTRPLWLVSGEEEVPTGKGWTGPALRL